MGRGQKRKADEPPSSVSTTSTSRVLRSGKKIEIDLIGESEKRKQPKSEENQSTLKPVRRQTKSNSKGGIEQLESHSSPEIFNGEQHPFMIPVIVKRLLEFWGSDLNTLKTARLVCKTWFQVALPLWRSTAVLTLVPDDIEKLGCDFYDVSERKKLIKGGGIKVSNFFLEMNTNNLLEFKKIPYSRFCLNSWEILNNQLGASRKFWNILRTLVKYMRLRNCEFKIASESNCSHHHALLTLVFKYFPEMGNLIVDQCWFIGGEMSEESVKAQEFVFRTQSFRRYQFEHLSCPKSVVLNPPEKHGKLRSLEVIGELPYFWEPFFRLIPNLETLRSRRDNSGDYNCLTSAIKNLREENQEFLNIRHLDLMSTLAFRLDGFGVTTLNECNLKLQSLCVEIGNLEPPMVGRVARRSISDGAAKAYMKAMLVPQKENLRILKLFRISLCGFGPLQKFSFGDNLKLENLSEVHLYGPVTDSFEFLGNVPNLQKLVINQKCEENWKRLGEFRVSCANKFKGDMIQNTPSQIFKNSAPLNRLTFLHVDVGFPAKSLKTLAKATPNLTILQTILNNATLVIAGKKWTNLQELKLLPGSVVNDDGVIKFVQNSKNVATNLRKFVLQAYCRDEALGNRNVEAAFLKMKGLQTLHIFVSKMTKTGEAKLKKNIQEVVGQRKRRGCSHKFYCTKKSRNLCLCYSQIGVDY